MKRVWNWLKRAATSILRVAVLVVLTYLAFRMASMATNYSYLRDQVWPLFWLTVILIPIAAIAVYGGRGGEAHDHEDPQAVAQPPPGTTQPAPAATATQPAPAGTQPDPATPMPAPAAPVAPAPPTPAAQAARPARPAGNYPPTP